MCRFIAIRSRSAKHVASDLFGSSRSLKCQSRCDSLRRTHSDGWGIAAFFEQSIEWARGADAAHSSPDFQTAAEQVCSKFVFAHVRKASKGQVNLANTHPFIGDGWVFMHNGTLTAFEKLRAQLQSETSSALRNQVLGQTDSECIFLWLMSRLHERSIVVGSRCHDTPRLRDGLAQAVAELFQRNEACKTETQDTAKLNFMLTNGRVIVGSRWDNTLWYQTRPAAERGRIQAWLIASEPTTDDEWFEIPNRCVFSLDEQWRWTLQTIKV